MKKNIFICIMVLAILFITSCDSKTNLKAVSDEAFVDIDSEEEIPYEKISMKIGLLKDTTAIGMSQLMKSTKEGTAANFYEFSMATSEDEIVDAITNKNIDVAFVSANVAAKLHNMYSAEYYVAAISSIGKVQVVESGESVTDITSLQGKTIYCHGKSGTEAQVLDIMLDNNNITADVTIVYKDDINEIINILDSTDGTIAVLEEPYASLVTNDRIRKAICLTDLWDVKYEVASVVSDVIVARKSFVDANTPSFDEFLNECSSSVEHSTASAQTVVDILDEFDIFESEKITGVIEECGMEYYESEIMQEKMEEYFKILYTNDASSIGDKLPESDFYYIHNLG